MLNPRQAADIAAAITARAQLRRSDPCTSNRRRTHGINYSCPETRALSPEVRCQVHDRALASLHGTHAYNQLLVAALISVAALCLLTPVEMMGDLVLAAITTATCAATRLFRHVYLRRAVKLIAAELAKLGH